MVWSTQLYWLTGRRMTLMEGKRPYTILAVKAWRSVKGNPFGYYRVRTFAYASEAIGEDVGLRFWCEPEFRANPDRITVHRDCITVHPDLCGFIER